MSAPSPMKSRKRKTLYVSGTDTDSNSVVAQRSSSSAATSLSKRVRTKTLQDTNDVYALFEEWLSFRKATDGKSFAAVMDEIVNSSKKKAKKDNVNGVLALADSSDDDDEEDKYTANGKTDHGDSNDGESDTDDDDHSATKEDRRNDRVLCNASPSKPRSNTDEDRDHDEDAKKSKKTSTNPNRRHRENSDSDNSDSDDRKRSTTKRKSSVKASSRRRGVDDGKSDVSNTGSQTRVRDTESSHYTETKEVVDERRKAGNDFSIAKENDDATIQRHRNGRSYRYGGTLYLKDVLGLR